MKQFLNRLGEKIVKHDLVFLAVIGMMFIVWGIIFAVFFGLLFLIEMV